jgi:hypothetical protein
MSKTWITVAVSELGSIDFGQTLINNADTAPKNIAGTLALIKWAGDMPSSISSLTTKSSEITYEQALDLLGTADWINGGML